MHTLQAHTNLLSHQSYGDLLVESSEYQPSFENLSDPISFDSQGDPKQNNPRKSLDMY
jgi:hypothetical protein